VLVDVETEKSRWTLSEQAQEFQNDENPIGEDLLGIPFVIYVNDDCEMQ